MTDDSFKIGYIRGKTAPVLVSLAYLRELIAGDLSKTSVAFLWGDTLEGPDYWSGVRAGTTPLPEDRLTAMLNEAIDHPAQDGVMPTGGA